MFIRSISKAMTPVDKIVLIFAGFLAILTAIFHASIDAAVVYRNLIIILVSILFVNYLRSRSNTKGIRILHAFYIMPVVVLVFKTVEKISYAIHGRDFDDLFIAADRMLFGVDPTRWLSEHLPLSSFAVEVLMICYFSYYFLFIALTWELFQRLKHHTDAGIHDNELESYRFVVVYGFLFSYIGYLLLPGIGPRFTLHEFSQLPVELPGLWLTDFFRSLIDSGENIHGAMTSAEAMKVVTRDVFPSGHTIMTFVTMLIAIKYDTRSKWIINILGVGLIIATVLLRYHYVIDVIAGVAFAVVVLYTAPSVSRFLSGKNLTRNDDLG
jgi:membrane-associated phospholipid phosphatase